MHGIKKPHKGYPMKKLKRHKERVPSIQRREDKAQEESE